MSDLAYLSTLDEVTFEAERCRIIGVHLASLPEDVRRRMLAYQMKLDLVRFKTTPEEFMAHIAHEAMEAMENLSDQLVRLKNIIDPPNIKVYT